MFSFDRGSLAVDLYIGIAEIKEDGLNIGTHRINGLALASVFEAQQHLVFDLDIPGEVVLSGLNDGSRCRDGIAAALHLDTVEIGPIGHVIVRVELATDKV